MSENFHETPTGLKDFLNCNLYMKLINICETNSKIFGHSHIFRLCSAKVTKGSCCSFEGDQNQFSGVKGHRTAIRPPADSGAVRSVRFCNLNTMFVQTRFIEMMSHVKKQFEFHENDSKQFGEQTHAFDMVHAQWERFAYIYQAQGATNSKRL